MRRKTILIKKPTGRDRFSFQLVNIYDIYLVLYQKWIKNISKMIFILACEYIIWYIFSSISKMSPNLISYIIIYRLISWSKSDIFVFFEIKIKKRKDDSSFDQTSHAVRDQIQMLFSVNRTVRYKTHSKKCFAFNSVMLSFFVINLLYLMKINFII